MYGIIMMHLKKKKSEQEGYDVWHNYDASSDRNDVWQDYDVFSSWSHFVSVCVHICYHCCQWRSNTAQSNWSKQTAWLKASSLNLSPLFSQNAVRRSVLSWYRISLIEQGQRFTQQLKLVALLRTAHVYLHMPHFSLLSGFPIPTPFWQLYSG